MSAVTSYHFSELIFGEEEIFRKVKIEKALNR